MKPLCKSILPITLALSILMVAVSVFAQGPCPATGTQYCNPLGNTTDIPTLTGKILTYLLQITAPLAGLGIVMAGLFYVYAAASGNEGKTKTAKSILTYVLIGSIIVVGATVLANAIKTFLTS